jgi:hypothetical protein
MILSNCNSKFAQNLKQKISQWITKNLKLTFRIEKTIITNLKAKSAKFLGFSIKAYERSKLVRNPYGEVICVGLPLLTFDIDLEKAFEKLIVS